MQNQVKSPMSPMSPVSPMSPMNIHAKPFIPKFVIEEEKMFDELEREFVRQNAFIFECAENLKTILSWNNTPYEDVKGERFRIKKKFVPTLSPLKEVNTWAQIVSDN